MVCIPSVQDMVPSLPCMVRDKTVSCLAVRVLSQRCRGAHVHCCTVARRSLLRAPFHQTRRHIALIQVPRGLPTNLLSVQLDQRLVHCPTLTLRRHPLRRSHPAYLVQYLHRTRTPHTAVLHLILIVQCATGQCTVQYTGTEPRTLRRDIQRAGNAHCCCSNCCCAHTLSCRPLQLPDS